MKGRRLQKNKSEVNMNRLMAVTEQDVYNSVLGGAGVAAAVAAVLVVLVVLFVIFYVLTSVGIKKLMEAKHMPESGKAWVPFLRMYILGCIVEDEVRDQVVIGYNVTRWIFTFGGLLVLIPHLGEFLSIVVGIYMIVCLALMASKYHTTASMIITNILGLGGIGYMILASAMTKQGTAPYDPSNLSASSAEQSSAAEAPAIPVAPAEAPAAPSEAKPAEAAPQTESAPTVESEWVFSPGAKKAEEAPAAPESEAVKAEAPAQPVVPVDAEEIKNSSDIDNTPGADT